MNGPSLTRSKACERQPTILLSHQFIKLEYHYLNQVLYYLFCFIENSLYQLNYHFVLKKWFVKFRKI